jgi:hypothetical protein
MHETLPHAGKAAQYTSKFRAISTGMSDLDLSEWAISNYRNTHLCTALLHQNATIFNVDLETASTPIAMGDYPISSAASTNAVIAWGSLDASCKAVTDGSDYAKTGTVKITRVSATEVAGEFSFTTAGGVSVQGQFSAPICGSEPSFMCVP